MKTTVPVDGGTTKSLHFLIAIRPVAFIAFLLVLWQIAVSRHPNQLLPGPVGVARGIVDLLRHGLLLKYAVASLFRVTWGFFAAAVIAIPLGLTIGWYRRAELAVNPLVQIFRPDLASRLDTDRHSLVRGQRPGRHFPHLRRLFLSRYSLRR